MDDARPSSRALWAYAGPFGLFVLMLGLPGLTRLLLHPSPPIGPEFWVYPLQTLLCGAMLFFFRRDYPRAFGRDAALWGTAAGVLVFVLWISPQAIFHAALRIGDGFDPTRLLAANHARRDEALYWMTVLLRFLRLVVVVPLLEEIFWRGFLLRYLIKEDFLSMPFGSWTPLSFGVVTLGFMLEHNRSDWPAALGDGHPLQPRRHPHAQSARLRAGPRPDELLLLGLYGTCKRTSGDSGSGAIAARLDRTYARRFFPEGGFVPCGRGNAGRTGRVLQNLRRGVPTRRSTAVTPKST